MLGRRWQSRIWLSTGIVVYTLFQLHKTKMWKLSSLNQSYNYTKHCEAVCSCKFTLSPNKSSIICSNTAQEKQHKLQTFGSHICPQQFRNLADWVFEWNAEAHEELISVSAIKDVAVCLPAGAIIYAVGWHLDPFFHRVYPLLRHPFVLITGESDYTVPFDRHLHFLNETDSKIIHWFAQNGRSMRNQGPVAASRFTQIPIGLNCHQHSAAIHGVFKEYNNATNVNAMPAPRYGNPLNAQLSKNDPLKSFPLRPFYKWLLLNFDATTDTTGERKYLLNHACNNWLNFTDCHAKDRGVKQYIPRMLSIYLRNSQYPFWLSPKGNGMDCHRTWEALLLGRIPIIRRGLDLDPLFDKLPVLYVDQWKFVNARMLKGAFDEIIQKRIRGEYDFDKLKFDYWRRLILSRSRHNFSNDPLNRPARCWGPAKIGTRNIFFDVFI